jgi:hypothetical protein
MCPLLAADIWVLLFDARPDLAWSHVSGIVRLLDTEARAS